MFLVPCSLFEGNFPVKRLISQQWIHMLQTHSFVGFLLFSGDWWSLCFPWCPADRAICYCLVFLILIRWDISECMPSGHSWYLWRFPVLHFFPKQRHSGYPFYLEHAPGWPWNTGSILCTRAEVSSWPIWLQMPSVRWWDPYADSCISVGKTSKREPFQLGIWAIYKDMEARKSTTF